MKKRAFLFFIMCGFSVMHAVSELEKIALDDSGAFFLDEQNVLVDHESWLALEKTLKKCIVTNNIPFPPSASDELAYLESLSSKKINKFFATTSNRDETICEHLSALRDNFFNRYYCFLLLETNKLYYLNEIAQRIIHCIEFAPDYELRMLHKRKNSETKTIYFNTYLKYEQMVHAAMLKCIQDEFNNNKKSKKRTINII